MATLRTYLCCGSLRMICFVIGYMYLISAFVDIVSHFFIVAVVSRGFECDVDRNLLALMANDRPWFEDALLVINFGSHGFYPFPPILRSFINAQIDYMPIPDQPRCYPGMIHVSQIDILNFLINMIWLKVVISYVNAVHKKNPEAMRMYFGLSVVKMVLQVMYLAYEPVFQKNITVQTDWCLQLSDISLASIFLYIVYKYIKQLRSKKTTKVVDQPPTYIECLIMGPQNKKEQKPAIDNVQPNEHKYELPPEVTTGRA